MKEKRKEQRKRFLASVLIYVILIQALPGMPLVAKAEGVDLVKLQVKDGETVIDGAEVTVELTDKLTLLQTEAGKEYQVQTVSANGVAGTYPVTIKADGYKDYTGNVAFTEADGSLNAQVDISSCKLYTISGTVRENTTNGNPISQAVITGNNQTVYTNEQGQYSITVPNGTYELNFSKNGYETKSGVSVIVNKNNETCNQVLRQQKNFAFEIYGIGNGTVLVKKNNEAITNRLQNGVNNISCYYGDKLDVTVSANSVSYIDWRYTSGITQGSSQNDGTLVIASVTSDCTAMVTFDEYTSIKVTKKNNSMSTTPRRGIISSGRVDVSQGNSQFLAIPKANTKRYPVVEDKNGVCNRISYGQYQFMEEGSVEVAFPEDNILPSISVSGNTTGEIYTNHDMNVYLNVEDLESGIKTVSSQIDNGLIMTSTNNNYLFAIRSFEFEGIIPGVPVTFRATDNVGNTNSASLRVFYDTEPPTVTSVNLNSSSTQFTQNGTVFVNKEPKLDAVVTDDFGKECNLLYYVSQEEKTSEQLTEMIGDFTRVEADVYQRDENDYIFAVDPQKLQDGQNYVYVTAEDKAGNVQTERYGSITLLVDDTAPSVEELIDVSPKAGTWKKPSETISMNGVVSDEKTPSGLCYTYVVIDADAKTPHLYEYTDWTPVGDATKEDLSYEFIKDITENREDGSYKVWVWAKDGCQNISAPKTYIFHIDGTSPCVTDMLLHVEEDGAPSKRFFAYSFGNFFHKSKVEGKTETVYLTVNAKDIAARKYVGENTGVGEVSLYYETVEESEIGNAYRGSISQNSAMPVLEHSEGADSHLGDGYQFVFQIPENQVFYKIMVVVSDKAGNYAYSLPTTNGYDSDLVMVDQKAPTIDFKIDGQYRVADYIQKVGKEKREWYKADKNVMYQIAVEDVDSGIFEAILDINDKNLVTDQVYQNSPKEMVKNTNYKASAFDGVMEPDGRFSFAMRVQDNAGNVSTDSKNIYIDMDKPKITEMRFESGEKDELTVVPMQYGYFFRKETKVTVTATDFIGSSEYIGSGVKNITYYLQSSDGSKSAAKKLDVTEEKDGKYVAEFIVPADFKGQIFMRATDNVGQQEAYRNPKGVVIESLEDHCSKYSYTKIEMSKTSYKDAEGNPLYNHQPTVVFDTWDSKSGIAKEEWSVKKTIDNTTENAGELQIKATYNEQKDKWDSVLSGDEDWNVSSEMDLNLVTKAQKQYAITTEQNHMVASLKMTDNVGNSDEATRKTFSVDTTKPVVTVEYDNNEVYNEKYYNKERNATVTVQDANFSSKDCTFDIIGPNVAISEWKHVAKGGCNGKVHSKDCVWQCNVAFEEDGDYTFAFSCTDLAGWKGSYDSVDEFTIDKTNPEIKVDYNNNNVKNQKYYNEARVATVQIDEHNFEADDVEIIMTAMDSGKAISVPAVNGWSQNEDLHTATIAYDYDGEFTFEIAYTDLANNEAEAYTKDEFVVDLTEPEIEITGVEDKSANNGKVAPIIVCTDTNLDLSAVDVSLIGINGGNVSYDSTKTVVGKEIRYAFKDMPHKQELDDLYTLHVNVEDKAGNQFEQEIQYSVNRFGSVYIMSESTQTLIDQCYTNKVEDIVIQEVNVDRLTEKKVVYSRDGEIVTLEEGKGYSLKESGGDNSWKVYDYVISGDNFEQEGRYIVTLYSEDKASNASDNKVKGKNVEFVVDKTAPSVVISGISAKGQYNEENRTATINVEDNIGIETVVVYLNGKKAETFKKEQLEKTDGNLTVRLSSSNNWQELKVVSKDCAGNETASDGIRFLLTKNALVQWYQNSTAFYGSLGGLVLITLAGIFFFRRKKIKIQGSVK